MVRNIFIILVIAGIAVMLGGMIASYSAPAGLGPVASHYAEKGVDELGAVNLVTAVVVSYRGLDTLGEVTVLFLIASILGFFLVSGTSSHYTKAGEILTTGVKVLAPFLILTGVYIIINGHLTPGGGFQGGALMASAFLFFVIAGFSGIRGRVLSVVESSAGVLYVVIGLTGLAFAAGFLDTAFPGKGVPGALVSAGVIPVISILIGLKVGAELSSLVMKLHNAKEEG